MKGALLEFIYNLPGGNGAVGLQAGNRTLFPRDLAGRRREAESH